MPTGLPTEVVTYEIDGEVWEFTVQKATLRQAMVRQGIRREAAKADYPDDGSGMWLMHFYDYADVMGGVVEAKGLDWPPTFEEFVELPEECVARVEAAVYELNPNWNPVPAKEEESEEGEEPQEEDDAPFGEGS